MKSLVMCSFLLLYTCVAFGQSLTETDHYKYWRMRSRLRNHFVAVGYEKGANLNTMTMTRFITRFFFLVGLCLGLSTCKREEPCPPEEEEAAIQFRAMVRSFGDRYKVTGYTINGVDRTSYLDTLHLRNKVIDFRDFDKPNDRVNRKPTDPSSECYRVATYFPSYSVDTISKINARNYTIRECGSYTKLFGNEVRLGLAWSVTRLVELQSVDVKCLIPSLNRTGGGVLDAKVDPFSGGILLSNQINGIDYILTLTPR